MLDCWAQMNGVSASVVDVKLRPAFAPDDWAFKVQHIRTLLAEGHRIRLVMVLRGQETETPDLRRNALRRVFIATDDLANVEGDIITEGRRQLAVLVPRTLKGDVDPGDQSSSPPTKQSS